MNNERKLVTVNNYRYDMLEELQTKKNKNRDELLDEAVMRYYDDEMEKIKKNKSEIAYNQLSRFLNSAYRQDIEKCIDTAKRDHRYIKNKLFFLMALIIKDMAAQEYDDENEISILKAREIVNKVPDLTEIPVM